MDVEEEQRDESRSSKAPNIRRRIMTKTSMEESRMDDEGEEGEELRSSTVPNTRRRTATKTSMEENKSDERAVAVTTQESLDGVREKAMTIGSLDELEASSGAGRWSSSGRAQNDRKKEDNEVVRALVGVVMKEGDIVCRCFRRKSKLWKDRSLKRARSQGSALRVFTSSAQLANQLKINEIWRSWKIGDEERDG